MPEIFWYTGDLESSSTAASHSLRFCCLLYTSRTYGEVLSRITNDVDTLGQGLNQSCLLYTSVSENENTVCSPINLYIAFAMLAETSDGNTRQQNLDMLGDQDMDTWLLYTYKVSAPGQMGVNDLSTVLDLIHKAM